MAPKVVKCGFGGFSEARFELGNRLLDEVEAGGIARQQARLGGSVFHDPADGRPLVLVASQRRAHLTAVDAATPKRVSIAATTKADRVWKQLCHDVWPPPPAPHNHCTQSLGIPADSAKVEIA